MIVTIRGILTRKMPEEIVVETGCSVLPPVHVASGRRSLGSASQQVFISVNGLLFEIRRFLGSQKFLVRKVFWSLHGRDSAEIPDALEVGVAPRRSWHGRPVPGGRAALAHRCDRHEEEDGDDARECAELPSRLCGHVKSPLKQHTGPVSADACACCE